MVFTEADIASDTPYKSVKTYDGLGELTLKSATGKDIYIDAVNGRDVTITMHETEGADAITPAELLIQKGPSLYPVAGLNLNPRPATFFKITASKHLTLKADKPCSVYFIILFAA